MRQFFLPHIHFFQKVTLLQGFGTFLIPGPFSYTCSEHLGEYNKQ